MFFIRAVERVSGFVGAIGALLIFPLIGALFYEVVSRYVFRTPTLWASEISYMLMGSMFLLGMGYALQVGKHVNVDIFYAAFPPRVKAIADLIGYSIFLPATWWLSYELFDYAMHAYTRGEVTGLSSWNPVVWPFRVVWFTGFLVLSLQATAEVVKAVMVLISGEPFEKKPEAGYHGEPV